MAEADIRVEDYLNDKLQSTTDFEHLDTLLSSVEYQRSQLQSQLDDATRELDDIRRSAEDRNTALISQIREFESLQQSIDIRLQIAAASDAPDDAIQRLEPPMKRLHSVNLAHSYLVLLRDVQDLRQAARAHLPQSPKAALEPYTKLKRLSLRLRKLQVQADGAAVHLVTYVESVTDILWDEMKKTMRGELEAVLKERGWPNVNPDLEVDQDWLRCFERLLDLQAPEILYSPGVVTLLPVDVMAQIFVHEFRFHFMSGKPTSLPQAIGTHCFPWLLALIEKWEGFFQENFGPVLAAKFSDTSVSHRMVYMDPVCAFVASMLPILREKIASTMADATKDPVFLSSLMAQLMAFDQGLRVGFNYDGGDADNEWGGLASEVLDEHFSTWLEAEKKFALERFQAIMAPSDSRNIDYDFAAGGKTKPTFATVRVTDLLRSVTAQYEGVRRFSHKLRFLIDIQLTILDEFHDHLRGILEAYLGIISTVGRAFGVTKEQLAALEGTGALETLCKVYGSADHIVNTLKDWSNEEFFVTLWEQLQSRAKSRENQSNLAGEMSYDDVRDRTSSAVGTEEDGGVLFDETIAAYSQRRKRAQEFLSETLIESHRKVFKAYLHRPQWSTIVDDSSIDPYQLTAVTPELDEPLRILRRDLKFLSRALGTAVFRRIWREALERLNSMLWSDVLMSHRFTASGAVQFARDLRALCSLVERFIPDGSGALGGLTDALRLLNLPIAAEEGVMSLRKATDMMFTDNAEAKKALEEMDIDSLTPAHARQILKRRVENAE
ncbi:TIP-1 family-domain-containing protein [Lasiosphaeria miniovina]|uniref:TIP-1 family-domain-containing protein n=1 Tax=Lasiosphaeria miniovina TaxID=1954250 RepID=A0AA40ABZ1_9PEZI|nr:TIP-1 family-domain-containing protein [Lasiosphaeria miniovina]KAK0713099.1 TIP-1 family-domain-containing protein [Lasiosphaeria miniovina]